MLTVFQIRFMIRSWVCLLGIVRIWSTFIYLVIGFLWIDLGNLFMLVLLDLMVCFIIILGSFLHSLALENLFGCLSFSLILDLLEEGLLDLWRSLSFEFELLSVVTICLVFWEEVEEFFCFLINLWEEQVWKIWFFWID